MRLFVVRHGQTAWNLEGRAQGHTDIPLDDIGLDQARALAAGFEAEVEITKVFTSDLLRASQTAQTLADRLRADLIARVELRERSFGDFEGKTFARFGPKLVQLAKDQGIHQMHVTPPNGETWQQVWDRLEPFTNELRNMQENCVVVTHGGTGSLLMAQLVQGTFETCRSFSFGNTGIMELERRPEGFFKILRYNDTSHLGRSAALSGSVEGSTR
ncbi:MAG: histidine phosphatase family protein [Fimbriimonas sp.]